MVAVTVTIITTAIIIAAPSIHPSSHPCVKTPTLIVRKFKDRKEAQDYLNTAEGNSEFMGKDAPAHKIYFIGQNNYRDVLQKQNFGEYVKFYEEMYN